MCEEKNGLRNLNRAIVFLNWSIVDFSSGSDGKESAYNAGNPGWIPGLGRSPGGENDNPLQYSCLENSMDRGAWWATVHGVAKSWTRLRDCHTHTHTHTHTHSCFTMLCYFQLYSTVIQTYICTYVSIYSFSYSFLLCQVTSVMSDSVGPRRWQPTRLPHPWDSPGKKTGVGCHFLLQCMIVKSESEVT